MSESSLIHLKTVYTTCADILFSRATRLRERAAASSERRRGSEARKNAASKDPARQEVATRLAGIATSLIRAARSEPETSGPGIDAACFGYLCGIMEDNTHCRQELDKELADVCGRTCLIKGIRGDDYLEIMKIVVRWAR